MGIQIHGGQRKPNGGGPHFGNELILTGEIARSARLVERLRARVEFIAPVEVVPGAVEMQALVDGTLRMLRGEELVRDYDTERND